MPTMLRDAVISFPMLGDFTINPSASFTVFGITLYWYGAIIAMGAILAILFCSWRASKFGMTSDDMFDLAIWIMPFSIIGARLYFVAFEWDRYADDLMGIFKVWEGGMAIYGGVLAGALVIIIWSKIKKIPVGVPLDLVSRGLMIGQIIGRWANFINREAFGGETDIFCRMGLTVPGGETYYVHPTFLYESLWNLLGLILISIWAKMGKRKWDGQMMTLYVLWYGIGRAVIEGLRTDSLYLWDSSIRVSQALAAVSALIALCVLIVRRKKESLFVEGT